MLPCLGLPCLALPCLALPCLICCLTGLVLIDMISFGQALGIIMRARLSADLSQEHSMHSRFGAA